VLTVPEGWVLLPPGDAALTRAVKAAVIAWMRHLTQAAVEALPAGGQEGGGVEVAQEVPGGLALPELAEAVGQAGVGGVEVLADLAAQSRCLL
jgi:hypothetical protein